MLDLALRELEEDFGCDAPVHLPALAQLLPDGSSTMVIESQIDGSTAQLAVSREDLEEVLLPLCRWLRALTQQRARAADGTQHRVVVGVVGAAGAGKSTLCAALVHLCNRLWPEGPCRSSVSGASHNGGGDSGDGRSGGDDGSAGSGSGGGGDGGGSGGGTGSSGGGGGDGGSGSSPGDTDWALALSMDAYHLPNAALAARTRGAHTWKELKGHAFTLDAAALAHDLERARRDAGTVPLPVYDRGAHEAVAGRLAAVPRHRLVLVEGLHLLSGDGDWARVGAQLDRSVFLRVPRAAALRTATSRKVARGRDPADAAAHCARVDAPIYDALRGHEARAHVALTLRGCCEVSGGGGGGGDGGGSDDGGSSGARAGSEGGSGGGGGGRRAAVPAARHLALTAVSVRSSAAAAAEAVARAALRPPASPLPLLVLGLNPAVQRWFRLAAAARVGEVNRAAAAGAGAGGKGQNVAAALAQCGGGAGVVLAMFGTLDGGGGGGEAAPIERAFAGSGVRVVAAPTAAGVRTCVTVIGGDGVTTELVGPWGGSVTAAEADALTRSLKSAAPAQPYKGVAVMGSLPPGVPPDYPATLLSALAAAAPTQQAAVASQLAGAHVVLDTTAAVPALLRAVSSAQAEAALKVNAEELLSLAAEAAESGGSGGGSGNGGGGGGSSGAGGGGSGCGGSGGSGGGDGGGGADGDQDTREEARLLRAADALLRAHAALRFVAVTRGHRPSLLFQPRGAAAAAGGAHRCYWRIATPRIGSSGADDSSSGGDGGDGDGDGDGGGGGGGGSGSGGGGGTSGSGSGKTLLSATGAGDCVSSVVLRAWAGGVAPEVAMRAGAAAATASCLRPENSLYDIADAEAFLEQAHVHKVWLAGGSGS